MESGKPTLFECPSFQAANRVQHQPAGQAKDSNCEAELSMCWLWWESGNGLREAVAILPLLGEILLCMLSCERDLRHTR